MNGNFRKPEFVKRYEYTYFDLETPLNAIVPNNARQRKDNYRFVVDNSSEANPIDWYNAYLEVDFQLVTLADSNVGIVAGPNNGNQDATTTNGNTFIKEIQVECNGTSVYTNMKANEATNALTLLKYTKSYADSVGKDQFFYVDTSTGTTEGRPAQALYNEGFAKRKILTDASAVNKISIPLNQYSYFAAFKNQLHPNIKTNILIKLEDDNNIIFKKAAAPDSKVIVTKMRLWCPKIIFNGLGMKEYTEKYLKPKKWIYLIVGEKRGFWLIPNAPLISTKITFLCIFPCSNQQKQNHSPKIPFYVCDQAQLFPADLNTSPHTFFCMRSSRTLKIPQNPLFVFNRGRWGFPPESPFLPY